MTSLEDGPGTTGLAVDDPASGSKRAACPAPATSASAIPWYLREVYGWAYLNPVNARLLDREVVVACILFGNNGRLRRALLAELSPGQRVLQAAHVYGRLIPDMARAVGPDGYLDVIDVAPLQAALCRSKVANLPQVRVRLADAERPGPGRYGIVSCFFLLHELPDPQKHAVVNALLARVAPGGKAVFVDYHRPVPGHPLRWIMARLFGRCEPFAEALWTAPIPAFAARANAFEWHTRTFFGGLYQLTTATRPPG